MSLENKIKTFQALQRNLYAKNHLMALLRFDSETAAPKGSTDARGVTMSIMSEEIFKQMTAPETYALLDELSANKDALDQLTARQVELMNRELKLLKNIPMQEYIDYELLLNKSHEVWIEAKQKNDFALFQPYLEKIVAASIRNAGYIDSSKQPYDVLLDRFEHGFTMADYDPYFAAMKESLVPTILEIAKRPAPDSSILQQRYPIEKQKQLSQRLMELVGVDKNYCVLAEAEHPFSTTFSKYDARITTHYYEDQVESSLYSVIHESGHAMYEMHIADELQYSLLATGGSLGLHESQSRFYENIVGRSREFMGLLLPILKDIFPEQMKNATEESLYLAMNKVTPSLIRTAADELTYSLHVLIRYEIEKLLISGELKVAEAPKYWNELYKKHLGVDVPSDSEGILQDIHWSEGALGYFPTYSIGSAYGAQMLHKMSEEFNVYQAIANNSIQQISGWLAKNIHVHGCLYDPKDVIRMACGAEFEPQYYFDYLNKKYKDMYHI